MSDFNTKFFQLFSHARPAAADQRQTESFADMGEQNHIGALSPVGERGEPGALATRVDVHDLAQAARRDVVPVFITDGKTRLLFSAKNIWAFESSLERLVFAF